MGSPATSPPITISHIRNHDKEKKRENKNKSLSIYLNNKRKHEASDVELLIV